MNKENCGDEQCPIFIHSQNLSVNDYDGYNNLTVQNLNLINNNLNMLKTNLDITLKNLPYFNNIYMNYEDFISNNFSLRSDMKNVKKNWLKMQKKQ